MKYTKELSPILHSGQSLGREIHNIWGCNEFWLLCSCFIKSLGPAPPRMCIMDHSVWKAGREEGAKTNGISWDVTEAGRAGTVWGTEKPNNQKCSWHTHIKVMGYPKVHFHLLCKSLASFAATTSTCNTFCTKGPGRETEAPSKLTQLNKTNTVKPQTLSQEPGQEFSKYWRDRYEHLQWHQTQELLLCSIKSDFKMGFFCWCLGQKCFYWEDHCWNIWHWPKEN